MENKHTSEDLKIMQGWSLEKKIQVTQTRIMEWYIRHDGNVYISFSGGKDSTVLLDLARRIYPDIEAVFVDTGLEYPEIRDFVKTKENVTWLKPKMTFVQVLEKYGYPVISKEVAEAIQQSRSKPDGYKARLFDPNSEHCKKYGARFCLEKWTKLRDSDIPISSKCCNIMKKNVGKDYVKETGNFPIYGTMASESQLRKRAWERSGCNAFDTANPSSNPISFWTEQDIFQYLYTTKIPYCSVYGKLEEEYTHYKKKENVKTGKLTMDGLERTGCMFCMFGVHNEKSPNRFQKMAITHPKQYDYCINKLGCGEVLDFIGVDYKPAVFAAVEKDIM